MKPKTRKVSSKSQMYNPLGGDALKPLNVCVVQSEGCESFWVRHFYAVFGFPYSAMFVFSVFLARNAVD